MGACMKRPAYSLAFAVVAWLEATASLCTLGQWCPLWCMDFAKWYTLRQIRKRGDPA